MIEEKELSAQGYIVIYFWAEKRELGSQENSPKLVKKQFIGRGNR